MFDWGAVINIGLIWTRSYSRKKPQIFATYHTKYFTLTFFFYILFIFIFKQQKHGLNNIKKTIKGGEALNAYTEWLLSTQTKGWTNGLRLPFSSIFSCSTCFIVHLFTHWFCNCWFWFFFSGRSASLFSNHQTMTWPV